MLYAPLNTALTRYTCLPYSLDALSVPLQIRVTQTGPKLQNTGFNTSALTVVFRRHFPLRRSCCLAMILLVLCSMFVGIYADYVIDNANISPGPVVYSKAGQWINATQFYSGNGTLIPMSDSPAYDHTMYVPAGSRKSKQHSFYPSTVIVGSAA